jgi:hypothetical protein
VERECEQAKDERNRLQVQVKDLEHTVKVKLAISNICLAISYRSVIDGWFVVFNATFNHISVIS